MKSKSIPISVWKKIFYKGANLADFLPYDAYDEETGLFLLRDGGTGEFSIGAVIEINLLPAGGVTDTMAGDIARMVETIYTSPAILPGTAIQFIVYASPYFDEKLEEWENLRKNPDDILKEFLKTRKEFYLSKREGFFEDLPFAPKNLRGFITYRAFVTSKKKSFFERFFKTKPSDFYYPRIDLDEHRKKIDALIGGLKSISIENVSLEPRLLNAQELIDLLVEILNGKKIQTTYNPEIPISEQIFYSTMEIDNEGKVVLGERFLSIISTKNPPPNPDIRKTTTLLGDLYQLHRQIPCSFLLTVNTEKVDQFKFKAKIQRRQTIATLQANSIMGTFVPKKRFERDDLTYALAEHEKGHEFIRAYTTMTVFAPSEEKARQLSQQVQSTYRYLGYNVFEETSIASSIFLLSLPMGYTPSVEKFTQRAKTVLSNTIAHITPILADWKGTKNPAMLYFSRRGDILKIDFFDSPGNYNVVVAAASGSGKSFCINDIILNYLSLGARVFVIDIGYSYYKLCNVLGGEYIEFTEEGGISLNPFTKARTVGENPEIDKTKIEDPDLIDSEDLSLIMPLLSKMAAGSEKLTKSQSGILEQTIIDVFKEKKRESTITDVWRKLKNSKTKEGEELANMLFSWTKNGRYGKYFESPCNIEFKKQFVVLEFQQLRAHKDLQAVVLMAAISQIQKAIQEGNREQKKLLIIDEAWDLLSDVHAARFIEAGYRIFRKYNASAISITQGINDLYQNEAGRAAAENADFFVLLRQKTESIEMVKRSQKLLLNEAEFELLKSLVTAPGKFSEIFFYTPIGKGVGRLIVDPYSYWLFTTKGNEVAEIQRRMKEDKKPVHEIIKELAELYPRGL